jgi:coatomer protein complex subunit epsilon
LVQIYLKINRIDQAEKELKNMEKIDEDASLTQLSAAWIHIAKVRNSIEIV